MRRDEGEEMKEGEERGERRDRTEIDKLANV